MKIEAPEEFRAALERLRQQLENARADESGRPRPGRNGGPVTLARVKAALERLEKETYGICAACYLVIPKAELLMRPYAEYCPECRTRHSA